MPAFLELQKEMILREERLLHEETMIRRHQQIEKESLILSSPRRVRGKLDEGKEKGRVMTAMMKDLVNIEDSAIRMEVMRMRMGLCGEVVGRGGDGTRKGGDAAAELAALDFEIHDSCVQLLEIEAANVQAKIDSQ